MTVTQIVSMDKKRSRVYLDNESAFVLYKGELRLYHVAEGEELQEENYRAIIGQVLPKRAKLRAMNLLKSRDYTRETLRRKLEEGGYPEEIARQAVEYTASYGYVDDLRYARDYITSCEGKKSAARIETDLLRKGISKNVLQQAWEEWREQGGQCDEEAMIGELLKKRHYDPETADRKEKQRTYAFLMRKGFSADDIMRALKL